MSNENKIYIAYSPNENYISLCLVSMVSIAIATKENIEFIILYSNLSEKSKEILSYIKTYKNCGIQFKKISQDDFNGFVVPYFVTIEAWYRILLPWLFPEIDNIIYLDCDTMFLDDIKKLNDINISNAYFGAGLECVQERNIKRLNLKDAHYINSGVMNMNCKKWREDNVIDKIKEFGKNAKLCPSGDQDAINITFDEKEKVIYPNQIVYIETWFWKTTKEKYDNFIPKTLEKPVCVHFTGNKPNCMICKHTKRWKWWEVAKSTPYYTLFLEEYHNKADDFCLNNIWGEYKRM